MIFYFADAKRLIGRRFSDASVQSDMKLWPFKIISGPAEKPMIGVNYKGDRFQIWYCTYPKTTQARPRL
jgi:molecular chaperone DnaK (HSP70)